MGKEERFTKLIREHEAIIFKITTMYTNNGEDQQDLYQDIVYQLWKSFESFRNEAKISTWMYRVAMNTAITRFKKLRKREVTVPIENVVLKQLDTEDDGTEERIRFLYSQIQQLDLLEKGIMLLLLEGKKYEEIGEITGLSSSNVGTKISRIKKKLKKTMNS